MSNQNEKKIDDDEFIKNLDSEFPLSGGEMEEDDETEEDEDFKDSLDTEFPLSGGETEL